MDVFTTIIAFVLGFAASYLAQWPTAPMVLWYRYRSRRVRERKCYSLPKGKTFLVPSSSSENLSLYISQNAMSCVQSVAAMLRGLGYSEGRDFEVVFQLSGQDSIAEDVRTENLVIVCGPKTNKFLEAILAEFPSLLGSIAVQLGPQPALIYKGVPHLYTPNQDWALMAIKKNPYNPDRRIIILFGLRSIGTKGAGSFFANPGWAKARIHVAELLETQSGEIEVLLRIDHADDYRTIKTVTPFLG